MEKQVFRLIFLESVKDFLATLPQKAVHKIYYNIHRIACGEQNVDLFKKLENTNIWEFKTLFNRTAYRLLAFWDTEENALVVVTHGFIKKTQKTPKKEIAKAESTTNVEFNICCFMLYCQ